MSEPLTLTGRCVRLTRRQVDALVTALALPVLLMLLFVELFGGAIRTGGEYVTYVVPGVLVLCAGFGAGLTAVGVAQDMAGGLVDRLRSMDVRGIWVVSGHVAASALRNAVSSVLVVGVAVAIGFRPSATPAGWLAAAGLLLAFVLATSVLAAAIGLVARSPEAANGATFLLMFLPYASSGFVPVDTMPEWLRGFAEHQPVTPMVDALRALLLGTPAGSAPWVALGWCAAILAVSAAAAAALYARRTG